MAGRRGGFAGGIEALADLIRQHRGAFEYDWRTRFGMPISAIPGDMAWDEALRMLKILGDDPTSQVAAALSKWAFPASWDYIALADLIDVQTSKVKWRRKPKSYRRPWDKRPVVHGRGSAVSVEQWRRMRPQSN